jgi:DNA-binding transcriptional regulator/RsmH inhibitor MraZ
MKVPSAILAYLEALGDKRVFITTFNLRTARVYPLSAWRVNENFFENFKENPQAAEDVHFVAQELGADSDLDGQGRILFPTELRRRLGMENQSVWLVFYRGGFTVYGKDVYDQRRQRAFDRLEEKVDLLTQKGLM